MCGHFPLWFNPTSFNLMSSEGSSTSSMACFEFKASQHQHTTSEGYGWLPAGTSKKKHPLSNGLIFTNIIYYHYLMHNEINGMCQNWCTSTQLEHLTILTSHRGLIRSQPPQNPFNRTSLKGLAEGFFGGMPCCTKSWASEASRWNMSWTHASSPEN